MPERTLRLAELQPTDNIRESTILFLEAFTPKEIERRTGIPQVWETEDRTYLISDGNNRAAIFVQKKELEIKVDCLHISEIRQYTPDLIQEIMERKRKMQDQGIFTPYDFW